MVKWKGLGSSHGLYEGTRYYPSYSPVGAEETTINAKTGGVLTTDLNLKSGTS
jgi:hypothetical protein